MSEDIPYQGARYYKCALQVNSSSYMEKYGGGKSLAEDDYNQQIVDQCEANHIEVVGLADHGRVEDAESLRKLLKENDITVFPGFEISSSEKIHMVCLYDSKKSCAELNQFLGQLMGGNISKLEDVPTTPSFMSCAGIATKVKEQSGFWFAAHATGQNGLLRLSGSGDNYVHLWKKEDLVSVVQVPGKIEDLNVEQEDLRKYHAIIENNNPDYKRKKPIVVINAKDVTEPTDLKKKSASCLVKMTAPNFASFKQAFYDADSRIALNNTISEVRHSYIKSIKWEGAGFFENSNIALSKNLNSIIGGRGTGKSTLLESIRFVLDLPIEDRTEQKKIDVFRQRTLAESKITLTVVSKSQIGKRYTISRRFSEYPIVKNEDGEISNLSPADILPDIEFFGQNEILQIEQDEQKKLNLIYRFVSTDMQLDRNIIDIQQQLAQNRADIINAEQEFDNVDAMVNQAPKLKEQEKQFKNLGISDELKNVNLIAREENIDSRLGEQLNKVKRWLNDYQDIFNIDFLSTSKIEELPNSLKIKEMGAVFITLKSQLDGLEKQADGFVKNAQAQYNINRDEWRNSVESIKQELTQAMNQLPEQAGKSGKQLGIEYSKIVKQLESIKKLKTPHDLSSKRRDELYEQRKTLTELYRDTSFKRFNGTRAELVALNQQLKGKLKISLKRCGNIEALKYFLLSINGIGESAIKWLDAINEIDLIKWADCIKNNNESFFKKTYKDSGLTTGTVDKLMKLDLPKRLELEEIELKDVVEIELNTAHQKAEENYVPLQHLSTGQKCTAILNLMLLNRDDPLIIDQPEDNLDNAFIAERIVGDLRQSKKNRQFIFATHNANIPVFGDAELIVALSSKKDKGIISEQGSIDKDKIKAHASEILEGGEHAFSIRKEKYGF